MAEIVLTFVVEEMLKKLASFALEGIDLAKAKMGEFVLTFVVEEMLKKLASLTLEGIELAWGLKGKLQKLNDSLTFIRAVLHDAMERHGREESVKIWLRKLRDVAYEAEDVFDEFDYEILRQKVEGSTPIKKY
ncbi:hypothetical protein Tsubulata_048583 [Turnera subulata]|uniref:Disease resistance N-terminal domain-containing protein n=1 Tax=Turnera subulata TaxID=218843 RepID=A0A9Q0FJQ4_9ROSI|nr:hypothetical protein Tsubulata_048583 [Turnera subulata]